MKATVLVVDDDSTVRHLTTRVLSDAGYEVIAAATLQEATYRADHDHADLLLVDVRLESYNGLQLVFRERVSGRTRPVVVMSGYPDAVLVAEAERLGAIFLPKPFTPAQLVATVEQMLTAAHAADAPGEDGDRLSAH